LSRMTVQNAVLDGLE